MNLRIISTFTFLLIISILIFQFLYTSKKNDIQELISNNEKSIQLAYNAAFNVYELSSKKEHHSLIHNEKVLNILNDFMKASEEEKNVLRGKLYRLLSSHYKYLKSLNVRQFHFHTQDKKSLLRFHMPHLNGDSLVGIRKSVEFVNDNKKEIFGFEGGKIYPGFRYVFPIEYQNQHLGSVEYSVSFEAIEKVMKQMLRDNTYHLHLSGSISYDKVFKWHRTYFKSSIFDHKHYVENESLSLISNDLQNNEIIKKINSYIVNQKLHNEKIKSNRTFTLPLIIDQKGYMVTFLNIDDISKLHGAYLVTYTPNQNLVTINSNYNILYIIVSLAILLIFILALIIERQIKKILIQNKQLEKTNLDQFQIIESQKNELQAIFHTIKDGIAILDSNTKFLFFNSSYLQMTGYSYEELLDKSCKELSDPKDKSRSEEVMQKVFKDGFYDNFEKVCIRKDGQKIFVNMSFTLMADQKRILVTAKDVTEHKRKEKLLLDYMELIDKNIITSSTDLNGIITEVSKAFCKNSGFEKEEILGKSFKKMRHPDTSKAIYQDMWVTLKNDQDWVGEIQNVRKDGSTYWVKTHIWPIYDEVENKIGYTAIRHDITDKKHIEEISRTDGLTGIFNRRYFDEIFPKLYNTAKRHNELICFAILDIDHFKKYNDTYGHQMGDDVIIQVSHKIRDSLNRASDYLFRLGGEEFGIIFKVDDCTKAFGFSKKILESVESLQIVHEKNTASQYVTISMGLACINANDINSYEALYKFADDLLYEAKESGRNKVIMNH